MKKVRIRKAIGQQEYAFEIFLIISKCGLNSREQSIHYAQPAHVKHAV